jgi:serine/threonine protein kinase
MSSFAPYSVGKAPGPSKKIRPTRVIHTPPGSPVPQFSSSARSPDAPAIPGGLSLSLRNDFEIEEVLGKSAEGTVYLGKHKTTGELVALKALHKRAKSRNIADLPEDCLLHLNSIRSHRHILFLSQIDITENAMIWQCLSLCNAGDLLHYSLRADERALHEDTRLLFTLHVFIQLGEALAFLHHGLCRDDIGEQWTVDANYLGSILHNDIKPENIMLHFNESTNSMGMPTLRLGDFGSSTWSYNPHPVAGTPDYYSPEALNAELRGDDNGPRMQMASDVYVFGLTLYHLITGNCWPTGKGALYLRLPQAYEALGITQVIQHCLRLDPKLRPTMDRHPVSGLMRCVDYAYTERAKLHAESGHLGCFFWMSWRDDATKVGRGT